MSYYGSSRYRDAAVQLKLASEAQPDNLELRYNLAQSYVWSEPYPEALRNSSSCFRKVRIPRLGMSF
jgi:hypothetical protein